MLHSEFLEGLKPLMLRFGDRVFPGVLIDSLYKKFGKEQSHVFMDACDYLLCTSRAVPVLNDFYEAVRIAKGTTAAADKPKDTKFCSWCDQSGIIFAKTRSEPSKKYIFRCQCWRGSVAPQPVEVWNNEKHLRSYSASFYLDIVKEVPEESDLVFIQKTPEEINQLLGNLVHKMPEVEQNTTFDDPLAF